MTNVDTGIRARLNSLMWTVVDPKTKSSLLNDGVLSDQFLQDNHIRVVTHDFENVGSDTTDQTPPILFKPRPSNFLDDYPINPSHIKEPSDRKAIMHYTECTDDRYKDWGVSGRLNLFPRESAYYLYGWAYGCGVPRNLPPGNAGLFDIVGIKPVTMNHGLLLGFDIFDSCLGQKYTSDVLEYNTEVHGIKPHVIILGTQANIGHNGSITFGELVLILVAMQNRAYQPSVVDESDIEATIKDVDELLFKDEHRFPVLMVSIVGPQHGRIFYACMDGLDLVIKQSQLYSLEKRNDETLNFFSSFLLSKPSDETPGVI